MRVLIVSSWFPYPPVNGSKLRAYNLLRELAGRHSLSLLTFAEANEASTGDVRCMRELCEQVIVVRGHPFKHGRLSGRGLLSPVPRSLVQTFSPEMESRLRDAIPGHDAAVGLETGAALYLENEGGLARVFEEAEISWLRAQRDGDRHPARRARLAMTWWKYCRFIRGLTDAFERTTVVSEVERQTLLRIGCDPSRVCVVPNGVAREDLSRPPSRRSPTLVYSGAVTYRANYDAVLTLVRKIWPIVRSQRPDVSLVVTGSTDDVDLSPLRADGVMFTGYLEDVKHLVAASAACVVPLRLGGGTRLKILESMALGTPVIATTKGAEGLEITPGEDILIANEPGDFARQVIRVLDEGGLAERLARKGRALVDRLYTWDKIGAQLDTVLREAVDAFHARMAAS